LVGCSFVCLFVCLFHFKTRAAQGTHDLGADVRRQA
jgi:hypothetical protein